MPRRKTPTDPGAPPVPPDLKRNHVPSAAQLKRMHDYAARQAERLPDQADLWRGFAALCDVVRTMALDQTRLRHSVRNLSTTTARRLAGDIIAE